MNNNNEEKGYLISFGCLTKLDILYLYQNSFVGSISSEMRNSKSLSILDLSLNKLSGWIPLFLANLSKSLKILDLSSNNLVGEIP